MDEKPRRSISRSGGVVRLSEDVEFHGGAAARRKLRSELDRRRILHAETNQLVAWNVPFSGDQRALGSEAQHVRDPNRRRGRFAIGVSRQDSVAEQDLDPLQVLVGLRAPGAVQEPLERDSYW